MSFSETFSLSSVMENAKLFNGSLYIFHSLLDHRLQMKVQGFFIVLLLNICNDY